MAIGYTPTGFGGGPAAPSGSDSAAGNAVLAAHFPAASSNPTSILLRFGVPVWSDPGAVARAEHVLAAVPLFSSLEGPLDVNQAKGRFISPDGRTIRFDAGLAAGAPGSDAALRQVPAIRAAVATVARDTGASTYGVAGQAPVTYDMFALVVARQPGGGVYRDVLASLALGILMDAFLVRTLLVPSTVALLGRWNWWPSSYGSRARKVSEDRKLAGTCGR